MTIVMHRLTCYVVPVIGSSRYCFRSCVFITMFVCLFVCLVVCLFVCLFVSFLFVCLFVCLFICLFVCLIVCLQHYVYGKTVITIVMRLSVYTVNGAEITTLNLPRDSTMQWATKHGLRCIAAHCYRTR